MPAYTSIFKFISTPLVLVSLLASHAAFAFDPTQNDKPVQSPGSQGDEFSETPYTRYGEFNEDEDEAEATVFFQYGKFFGVSAGLGFQGVTGNRGTLWDGGFPLLSIKVHYWFSFTLALALEFTTVNHTYSSSGVKDVTMTHFGVDIRYYIDTHDAPDVITFASPFLLFGGGVYTKTETQSGSTTKDTDGPFGVDVGMGVQFPIQHKKIYFDLEAKFMIVPFADRTTVADGLDNRDGIFYSVLGSFLFTW